MRARQPFAAFLLLAACAGDSDPEAGTARLDFRELMRIDAEASNLVRPGYVMRGPRGLVLVTQPADREILLFDTLGSLVGRLGGPGEGPGEIGSVTSALSWKGDTIRMADWTLGRNIQFALGGASKVVPLPATLRGPLGEPGHPALGQPTVRQVRLDGTFLADLEVRPELGGPIWLTLDSTVRRVAVLMQSDGRLIREIGRLGWSAGHPCQFHSAEGAMVVPFCEGDRFAYAEGSSAVVLVQGGRNGSAASVAFLSLRDSTRAIHDLPALLVTIPDRVRDSVRKRLRDAFSGNAAMQRMVDAMSIPQYYPAVQGLVAGRNGEAWMQVPSGRPMVSEWLRMLPDGSLASVLLPGDTRLMSVSGDTLFALWLRADGLEDVVLYETSPVQH